MFCGSLCIYCSRGVKGLGEIELLWRMQLAYAGWDECFQQGHPARVFARAAEEEE